MLNMEMRLTPVEVYVQDRLQDSISRVGFGFLCFGLNIFLNFNSGEEQVLWGQTC